MVRSDGKHHGDIDIAIAGENEEAAVLIPIGYPADNLKEKKRKAIEEIVQSGIQTTISYKK